MRIVALKIVAPLVVPVLFTGCYTYLPIEPAAQLAPSLGMSDARLLTGSVVDKQADGFTLKVASVPMGTIGAQGGLFQQILITRADLLELESRRLDDTRTRIAVAAGVVGAAAVAATILRGHSSGESAVAESPSNFDRVGRRVHVGRFAPVLGVAWSGAPRAPGL